MAVEMEKLRKDRFERAESAIDASGLRLLLRDDHAGAFSSFEGWVRDHNHGRAVAGLCYEAYVALAQKEGERIVEEALGRFSIVDARCVHRIGELHIGELAVWVGVSAAHRGAAFDACRYVIDEVKSRVPIWKQERYREGDAGWLHPQAVSHTKD
ncbi:MAG: molybdenum cofactor biosynthesis protein MoaE [Pseudoxanthomonas sp.]